MLRWFKKLPTEENEALELALKQLAKANALLDRAEKNFETSEKILANAKRLITKVRDERQ